MNTELTTAESSKLAECEAVIERGLETFVQVGAALMVIRDRKLYRETHATFVEYCNDRWGMTSRRAFQLIDATRVVENVNHGSLPPPANERIARPLTKIKEPVEQAEVWQEAVETAPEGKVTAKHVEQVVKARVTRNPEPDVADLKRRLANARRDLNRERKFYPNEDDRTARSRKRIEALERREAKLAARIEKLQGRDAETTVTPDRAKKDSPGKVLPNAAEPARDVAQPERRVTLGRRPYTSRAKEFITAAIEFADAMDDEVRNIPVNNDMIDELGKARDQIERVFSEHDRWPDRRDGSLANTLRSMHGHLDSLDLESLSPDDLTSLQHLAARIRSFLEPFTVKPPARAGAA